MATFNRFNHLGANNGFDKRDPREDTIRRPAEEAQERIASIGVDTLALLGALPRAFARSQQRELKRLLSTGKDDKDPRVIALRTSLERTGVLLETAAIGQARIDRMLEPADRSVVTFSGFVSDENLHPLAGHRVQVSEAQGASLSAVTDAQGFFSIVIGKNSNAVLRRDAGLVGAMLGAKADPKNEAVKAEAAKAEAARAAAQPGATAAPVERVGRVEIFDTTGKQVHDDPQPLPLYGNTNLYREYVIGSDTGGGTRPFDGRKPFDDGGPSSFVRGTRDEPDAPAAGVAAPAAAATDLAAPAAETPAKPPRGTTRPSRPAASPAVDSSVAAPVAATPVATPASTPSATVSEPNPKPVASPSPAAADKPAPAGTRPPPPVRPARTRLVPAAPRGPSGRKKP
jgi:hypothetical protein